MRAGPELRGRQRRRDRLQRDEDGEQGRERGIEGGLFGRCPNNMQASDAEVHPHSSITILAEAYCVLFVVVRRIWVNFLRPCARVNHQTTYLLNRTPAPPGFEERQHSCRYSEERFEYGRCGRREQEVAPRSAAVDVREPARLRLRACECSGELRIHVFAQGRCKGSRQHSSQRQYTVVR